MALGALSPSEQTVIQHLRKLSQQSPEWKLTITKHQRHVGAYMQLEPTPYLKIAVSPDAFLAVE